MPRTISTNLLNHLRDSTVYLAVLVLINRVDGVVLGFTNWDQPIVFNGVTYLPSISMNPSAVKVNADMESDNMDIIGAIDSVYITDADLYAGRFDMAEVTVARINPFHTSWGAIVELYGNIGQISHGDGQFTANIDSLGKRFSQSIGDIVSPVCPVKQLGDSQCKVDIATYRFASTVASNTGDNQTLTFADAHVTGYFDYGMVRFNTLGLGGGLNYSLNMEVKTSTQAAGVTTIFLQEPMPYHVAVGDAVVLEAGCDRKGATCRNKFSNLVNFHGFLWVPGNDYLLTTGRPPASS